MLKEEFAEPSARFLTIAMSFSEKAIEAWKDETVKLCSDKAKYPAYERFIKWKRQKNEIAVFTMYAYADLAIPKNFDCIFRYDNPGINTQAPFILTQSIWEGWHPIDHIEHGHKHLCVLTFENGIPDIFEELHYETEKYSNWSWNEKQVLGICHIADMGSIIERRRNEIARK